MAEDNVNKLFRLIEINSRISRTIRDNKRSSRNSNKKIGRKSLKMKTNGQMK